jgi:hypothetical protein
MWLLVGAGNSGNDYRYLVEAGKIHRYEMIVSHQSSYIYVWHILEQDSTVINRYLYGHCPIYDGICPEYKMNPITIPMLVAIGIFILS